MSFSDACRTAFRAVHDSGARQAADIGWIVIHSTEGDTAQGAAAWFANPKSGGSANLVVDGAECFRTVPDLVVPWAAPPLNKRGFHIEIAGHSSWTREQWLAHRAALKRAAYKAADRAVRYRVPVRKVGRLGLLAGRKGITGHVYVSQAWHQSDHTDPGPNFPWDVFMEYVKENVKAGSL